MALLLACVAIWGVNGVASKIGTRPPYGFDPILFNGLRFLFVAPCIVGLIAWRKPEALRVQDPRDLIRYAVYALISITLGETLLTWSVHFTSVANTTLLGPGTIPLFTALWAVVLGEQRLSRLGWLGALVALAGVAIVASSSAAGFRVDPSSLKGDAIALGRSAVHGAYLLFLTRTLRERPVPTVTTYNIVFAALWFLPYVLWRAPHVPWHAAPWTVWAALAWAVVPTTVFGFLAWNWAMRSAGAVAATNVVYLQPVFAAVAAWLILGEPLGLHQALGGAVVVLGIVMLRWDTMLSGGFLPRWRWSSLRLPWRK
jgi:drug/metabolite transporter (DMT)-like permease